MSFAAIRGTAIMAVALSLLALGYWLAANKYGHQLARMETAHTRALAQAASDAQARSAAYATRQAQADKAHWESMKNAQTEIDALRSAVAAGSKRVYVKADCPTNLPTDTQAPGMGNGAAPELTGAARQDYLSLRSGIAEQRAQLMACQDILGGWSE